MPVEPVEHLSWPPSFLLPFSCSSHLYPQALNKISAAQLSTYEGPSKSFQWSVISRRVKLSEVDFGKLSQFLALK